MKKNANLEKVVNEMMEKLEQGIQNIRSSKEWREYLLAQSKFHNYSFGNVMLILSQKPTASRVAGFTTWKDLGRYPKKGTAIKILAPIITNKKEENEDTGEEEEKKVLVGFRYANVFDVSDTEGKELPGPIVKKLEGDNESATALIEALEEVTKIPVHFIEDTGSANGWYHLKDKDITINSKLSTIHKAKTWVHELAHSRLHNLDQERKTRNEREVEAEGIAFIVCNHFGLDTSDYSFGYVAGWSGNVDYIKSVGETIQKESAKIIKEITRAIEKKEAKGEEEEQTA